MAPAKKPTRKAPELAKKADYLQLQDRVDSLESFIEWLLYDVKGERGEALRKRFHEQKRSRVTS